MWQGKPVSEWTEEEKNHFLSLLMGIKWESHIKGVFYCPTCNHGTYYSNYSVNPNYFTSSGFAPIKRYMEKELPEVWEEYLQSISDEEIKNCLSTKSYYPVCSICLNRWLDLTNLITFLLDNQEWAWIPCPLVLCSVGEDYCSQHKEMGCKNGKIKHPALTFAEGVK